MKSLLGLFAFILCTQLSAQTIELIQMPLAKLKAKSAAGDPRAMVQLALRYANGVGVEANEKQCDLLMERAAKAGYATAMGICAANGHGMTAKPAARL
jgi:TPR repeat protein